MTASDRLDPVPHGPDDGSRRAPTPTPPPPVLHFVDLHPRVESLRKKLNDGIRRIIAARAEAAREGERSSALIHELREWANRW